MSATAAQQAPKQAQRQGKGAAPEREKKPAGLKDRLHRLPQAAGIAVMCVLLAVSLPVGNFRALQNATPKDFIRQGDVRSIIEDRIDAAENAVTVARRAGLSESDIAAVEAAVGEMEAAKTARQISRADQSLSAAVSELTTKPFSGEEERNMQRAADAFAEQGSFLRQEARAYNAQAEKAERLYEKLPMKFMLAEPDMYEGI